MPNVDARKLFADHTFEFPCPSCGHELKVKAKDILSSGSSVYCSNCNQTINVDGTDIRRKVDRSLKEFERQIKQIRL